MLPSKSTRTSSSILSGLLVMIADPLIGVTRASGFGTRISNRLLICSGIGLDMEVMALVFVLWLEWSVSRAPARRRQHRERSVLQDFEPELRDLPGHRRRGECFE